MWFHVIRVRFASKELGQFVDDESEIRSHGREVVELELGESLFVDIIDESGESVIDEGDELRIGESGLSQRVVVRGGRKRIKRPLSDTQSISQVSIPFQLKTSLVTLDSTELVLFPSSYQLIHVDFFVRTESKFGHQSERDGRVDLIDLRTGHFGHESFASTVDRKKDFAFRRWTRVRTVARKRTRMVTVSPRIETRIRAGTTRALVAYFLTVMKRTCFFGANFSTRRSVETAEREESVMCAEAEFFREESARRTGFVRVAGVGDRMRAEMHTGAWSSAGGSGSPTVYWWMDHSGSTGTGEILPSHIPASITGICMTHLRTSVSPT